MANLVVETGHTLEASPRILGRIGNIRIPSEQDYASMLNDCKLHQASADCGLCIKFAVERARESHDPKAMAFLRSIPTSVQEKVVEAISRLEAKLLPALET